MTFNEYQEYANKFAFYPQELGIFYTTLGITGEAGELANKVKKVIRDNKGEMSNEQYEAIRYELGDILWYIAMAAKDMRLSLDEIAQTNIEKLAEREQRNSLFGDGDNR